MLKQLLFLLLINLSLTSYEKEKEVYLKCLNAQLGKPFNFGKEGPESFDNLGLPKYCAKQAGLPFPDTRDHNEVKDKGVIVKEPIKLDFLYQTIYKDLYMLTGIVMSYEDGVPTVITGDPGEVFSIKKEKMYSFKGFFRLWP